MEQMLSEVSQNRKAPYLIHSDIYSRKEAIYLQLQRTVLSKGKRVEGVMTSRVIRNMALGPSSAELPRMTITDAVTSHFDDTSDIEPPVPSYQPIHI